MYNHRHGQRFKNPGKQFKKILGEGKKTHKVPVQVEAGTAPLQEVAVEGIPRRSETAEIRLALCDFGMEMLPVVVVVTILSLVTSSVVARFSLHRRGGIFDVLRVDCVVRWGRRLRRRVHDGLLPAHGMKEPRGTELKKRRFGTNLRREEEDGHRRGKRINWIAIKNSNNTGRIGTNDEEDENPAARRSPHISSQGRIRPHVTGPNLVPSHRCS